MRAVRIGGITLILFLSFSSWTLCPAQEKEGQLIKRIEGRVISRHGLIMLITPDAEAYVLRKRPKSDKYFNRVEELANQDKDVILNGKGTKELSIFEHINYSQGKKTLVWKERYRVFEVSSLKKTKSPSKITPADIEKALNLATIKEGFSEPSPVEGAPKDLTPGLEKTPMIPKVEGAPKDLTPGLEKTPAVSPTQPKPQDINIKKISPIKEPIIPRIPMQPSILAEIEGKVISVDRQRSPMVISVQSALDNNEIVTIFVPQGTGMLNKSGTTNVDVIKVGDQIDIWYREMPGGENKAEMITIVD